MAPLYVLWLMQLLVGIKDYLVYETETTWNTTYFKEEVKIWSYVYNSVEHIRGMYLSLSHLNEPKSSIIAFYIYVCSGQKNVIGK